MGENDFRHTTSERLSSDNDKPKYSILIVGKLTQLVLFVPRG